MNKRILALILALLMCVTLSACSGGDIPDDAEDFSGYEEEEEQLPEQPEESASPAEEGSWAIYWYLCGSDLESENGCATMDLQEMMEVELPEGVNVVIETGGASQWQNEMMEASKLQRWLYNSDGLQLLEELDTANMGEAQTLYDFLYFANENFPAEKVAVTFWNHGGGSVSGAAFDELHDLDSLNLSEMYQAFDAVWPADAENPQLELVGFDTCLMATVDVAGTFRNFAKYLVASEETEPGNGWLYSGWLGALAENPGMDGVELGRAICDSYYEGCEAVGTQEQTTLSLTDLGKVDTLLSAYEAMGQEALAAAAEDPGFFAELGRAAEQCENYGGNTKEQGYTNMVDLGHLARQTAWMLPSAQSVSDALAECVLYQVGGVYRSEATGLSCYYSYNGDVDDFSAYAQLGEGEAFKQLYAYELTGELGEGGQEYLASIDVGELPERKTLQDTDWDGAPLDLNAEGTAVLTLGPDANNILSGIGFMLYYVDEENDRQMLLGTDNDMTADWENGVFYDNFRGKWGALDGCLVYMELSYESEEYNLYSVPVLLNGEEYNLRVAYDFGTESWSILGAIQGLDDSGMASKEMRLLQEGDVITTIWKMASLSGSDDFEMYTADEITVTGNTSFGETDLMDGSYSMVFEMRDSAGNYAYSDEVTFDCSGGEITSTVYEN